MLAFDVVCVLGHWMGVGGDPPALTVIHSPGLGRARRPQQQYVPECADSISVFAIVTASLAMALQLTRVS